MKIHIGCGRNILDGFVNIDNSPSLLLAKLNNPLLGLLQRSSLINKDQLEFIRMIKTSRKEFLRANCLRLPFKDGSVDFCYTSHMLGWCLSRSQLSIFFDQMYRIMRPGAGLRLSFFDLDIILQEYQQHRDTIRLFGAMPSGIQDYDWRYRLKLLVSPNIQNGLPLNAETASRLLAEHRFTDIRILPPGVTTMEGSLAQGLDLNERAGESIYIECRKA